MIHAIRCACGSILFGSDLSDIELRRFVRQHRLITCSIDVCTDGRWHPQDRPGVTAPATEPWIEALIAQRVADKVKPPTA